MRAAAQGNSKQAEGTSVMAPESFSCVLSYLDALYHSPVCLNRSDNSFNLTETCFRC